MVKLDDGLEDFVKKDGNKAEEHQSVVTQDKNTYTSTCYIEAKAGEPFLIKYCVPPEKKEGVSIIIHASVDGKKAQRTAFCRQDTDKWIKCKIEGFEESVVGGKANCRTFRFGWAILSDDEAYWPSSESEDACTIKLEIFRRKRTGEYNHREPKDEVAKFLEASTFYERSSTAKYGLSVTAGNEFQRKIIGTCKCEKVDDSSLAHHVFIFKYRPLHWLKLNGIVPKDPDDVETSQGLDGDEVHIVENDTVQGTNNNEQILESTPLCEPNQAEVSDDGIEIDQVRTARSEKKRKARVEMEVERKVKMYREALLRGSWRIKDEIKSEDCEKKSLAGAIPGSSTEVKSEAN